MMNCPDGLLLIIELHTRSVLISVTDSNGSGSVSSTGAAFGDAGSGLGLSHHAVVGSGMDAHGTTVIAALRWCVLGIGCVCGNSTTR